MFLPSAFAILLCWMMVTMWIKDESWLSSMLLISHVTQVSFSFFNLLCVLSLNFWSSNEVHTVMEKRGGPFGDNVLGLIEHQEPVRLTLLKCHCVYGKAWRSVKCTRAALCITATPSCWLHEQPWDKMHPCRSWTVKRAMSAWLTPPAASAPHRSWRQ